MLSNKLSLRIFLWSAASLALLGWSVAHSQEALPPAGSDATSAADDLGSPSINPNAVFKPGVGDVPGWGMESAGGMGVNPATRQQLELKHLLERHAALGESGQSAEQQQVREKIHALLTRLFEQRQARRAAEIAEIEKRLAKLKDLHKKRDVLKKSIIANRLQQMLEDAEGLGWGEDPPASQLDLFGRGGSSGLPEGTGGEFDRGSGLLFDPASDLRPR